MTKKKKYEVLEDDKCSRENKARKGNKEHDGGVTLTKAVCWGKPR